MVSAVAGRAWVVVAGLAVALLAGCGADRTSPPSDLPARIAAACEPGASGTSQSRFVAAPGYPQAGQVGLVHDRATYRPGALIVLVPVNRRRHNVSYGYPYSLERLAAGVWRRLPPTDGEFFRLPLLVALPGRAGTCVSALILTSTIPGHYRVTLPGSRPQMRTQISVAGRPLRASRLERSLRRHAAPDRQPVPGRDRARLLAACRERVAAAANLDDDGRADRVVHTSVSINSDLSQARLVVCLGNGRILTRPGIGMSEELRVIDIDGDGRAEVYFGGNSVCESGGNIAVVRDGRLRLLRGPDGHTLSVSSGCGKIVGQDGGPYTMLGQSAWGCRHHRLVQIVARRQGRQLRLTRIVLRLDGLHVRRVATIRRTMPGPPREAALISRREDIGRCRAPAPGQR